MRKTTGLLIAVFTLLIAGLAWGQGMQGQQNQSSGQNGRMPMGMMGRNTQQPSWGPMMGGGMNGMGMMSMMHGGMMGSGMMGYGMMGAGSMSGNVPSVFTILGQSGTLNLMADQQASLQKEVLELQKNLIQLRSQAAIASIDLREALDSENPNQQDVQKILQKKIDAQTDLQKSLVSSYFQGLNTLTADQKAQLNTTSAGCMMMGNGNRLGSGGTHGMMGQ